jgi:hypothetical protein
MSAAEAGVEAGPTATEGTAIMATEATTAAGGGGPATNVAALKTEGADDAQRASEKLQQLIDLVSQNSLILTLSSIIKFHAGKWQLCERVVRFASKWPFTYPVQKKNLT